jgi:UDP-N-acetylmuramoyl-L-alanyl-D-glutamate--2,6-diaminopimelate ligase
MLLKKLIKELKPLKIYGDLDTTISGISYDSRMVSEGDLFISIKGMITDGHLYIKEALSKGAKAFVVEKWQGWIDKQPQILVDNSRVALAKLSNVFYEEPTSNIKLIGVTGTNGKTTTTYLIDSILNQSGKKCGLIGTIECRIGNNKLFGERTTPESLDLCRFLRMMIDRNIKYCVIEVSSHALDLHRVDFFNFYGVVFTNLTHEHLDYHKSIENYFNAKKKLFTGENSITAKIAVINNDDKWGIKLSKATKINQIKYSLRDISNKNTHINNSNINNICICAKNIKLSMKGTQFLVVTPIGDFKINTKLIGEFNVYNILAAISIAINLGISIDDIKSGIEIMKNIPGRFEKIDEGQPFYVIIDYAHTPGGIESLIKTVRKISMGRIISLFGCGGDRDKAKRPIMGAISGGLSDYVIITNDNPRSEKEEEIAHQIEEGVLKTKAKDSYLIQLDRRKAIETALEIANEGDNVLIMGKGHEKYQQFSDFSIPFDDREVTRKLLREIGYR